MSAEDHRDADDTRAFQGRDDFGGGPYNPYGVETRAPATAPGATGSAGRAGSAESASIPGTASNGVAGSVRPSASRRAHLRVSRINPWSVMKFSFVVSLVCFIILFVAVAVLYAVLSVLGVFEAVSTVVSSLGGSGGDLFSASRVLGYAAFLGGINVVLITLLATVGAFIYNLAADLVGGVDVTLTERD